MPPRSTCRCQLLGLAARGRCRTTSGWTLSAQFFALSIDEYDGHLQSYRASLTWQPRSWLGIGVGYNLFSVDMAVENDDLDGALDWIYGGPMVFYRASF